MLPVMRLWRSVGEAPVMWTPAPWLRLFAFWSLPPVIVKPSTRVVRVIDDDAKVRGVPSWPAVIVVCVAPASAIRRMASTFGQVRISG
jgi:hypothetical protein